MTVLADKKAERGGPGPKGRQPKWAMPASEAWYAALKKSFFMVHTLRRLLFVTLAIGVYSFGQAQETLAYSFGPQEMLSLSGEGNSSHYTTFSVVEPITGLSTSDDNRTEVYAGFLGAVGGSNAQPSILAISSLAVHENKPVGTLVGEFNATNFESESVTFSLVQGEGSADNEHFSLSTHGLLSTRAVFDYEQGVSEFTIRARASGTGEEWAEKVFLISLIDVNEDQDGDGILDDQDPDDDNDGYSDILEEGAGSDPRNPGSTPLNYGLVAWYPFDGNASDMSGNGNHGTVNGATLGTDRHGVAGKAYSFDGEDDKIKIPHSVLNSKTELTVSFWYKMDSLATTFQHFLSGANSSHDNRFLLELRPTQPCFLLRDELTSVNAKIAYYGFSGYPFFRSRWVNLVLSRDLLGASLYSYGSLKHRSDYITNSLSIDQDGLWIGADQDSVGGGWVRDQHLHGFLDDFRIYDRALSAVEIGLLYDTETELPTGAVTSAKLSPELSDLIDGNGSIEQALPAGSVIARYPGEEPPPGYTLFQRPDYNASRAWEEKASISQARYAFDGAEVIDGKIYFTGMKNDTNRTGSKLLERYDPATDTWETLADRPKVRYAPCTTVLDGKYYVMGGDQRAVEIYDPQTNSWSEGVAMPIDVDHCGAVTFEGKIYVMGENQAIVFDPSTNEWTLKSQSNFTTYGTALAIYEERIWSFTEDGVESYDPRTDTWQVEKSLAVNRQFATAWIYDNQLYVACGRVWQSDDKSRFNLIDRYDSKNQKWVEVGHFPGERAVMDSAVIGNRVYIVGGAKPSLHLASMYSAELPLLPAMNLYFKEGNVTAEAELSTLGMADGSVTLGQLAPDALAKIGLDRNPATAEGSLLAVPRGEQPPPGYALYKRSDRNGSLVWEEKAPISLAGHVYDGLEVLNGEVYLQSQGAVFEKYLESNNSWKSLTPSPNVRSALASASLGSKLYLIGGENPIVPTVDFYDSQTKEWQTGPSLPIAVRAGQALTVEDTIYFVGGSLIDGNSSARVFSLTEGDNHWIERASMPTPRRGHKLVYFKNRIWSLGGWSEGIGNLQTVESYDPKTDTWRTEPSMVESRHWPVTWSNGAKLFVGGGGNHGSTLFKATIEAYDPDRGEWELVDNLPYKSYVSDAIVHDGEVYFVGGNVAAGDHSDKFYTADITPPMDLYYREANASGTISVGKMNTELLDRLDKAQYQTPPIGQVFAFDRTNEVLNDFGILERNESLSGRNLFFRSRSIEPAPKGPTDLHSTGQLVLFERGGAGIIVGQFKATAPQNSTVTYQLEPGQGDLHNGLFSLDPLTGFLRVHESLDYYLHGALLSIRVQARDEDGHSIDEIFEVHVKKLELVEIKDFRLSNHSIVENKPVGTWVGQFEMPDSNGLEHTYSLVQGDGDEGNAMFQLYPEGKLTNRKVFDYERMQRTSVRVRAVNKTRGVLEKIFHLSIEDQPYMPGIDTVVDGKRKKGGVYTRYKFGGMVYDKGEITTDLLMGFLISGRPIRKDGLKDTSVVRINLWEGRGIPTDNFRFSGDVWTLEELRDFGSTVYIKAFAQSKDGKIRIYGEQEVINLGESSVDGLWKGASEIWGARGWWESRWFGLFYKSESGWIMHDGLGWVYPTPSLIDGIWLWKESLGWMWTKPDLFPFLYLNRTRGWAYFYGEFKKTRLLFEYKSEDWIILDEKQINETENAR